MGAERVPLLQRQKERIRSLPEQYEKAMKKTKVCVYAICKNEGKFVKRWLNSMWEADEIYVLDTGSEDDTVEQFLSAGDKVHLKREIIEPFRFDVARNKSLDMLPEDTDICVCTDLDELFHPGWREKLEQAWQSGVGRIRYRYTWSFQADGSEGCVFWIDKIHCPGYRFVNPVHEVLEWQGKGAEPASAFAEGIQLDHFPDDSKSRAQYLPLLELSVREDPENDRNMHYLGREYMFHGAYDRAIGCLKRHLDLKSATWKDERCASMRYIARCYLFLGKEQEAESWFLRAVAEAPHLREPYLDYAKWACAKGEWALTLFLTSRALAITSRPRSYITEAESWGSLPYDLASLGYYYTGQTEEAKRCILSALSYAPDDSRLKNNLILMTGEQTGTE